MASSDRILKVRRVSCGVLGASEGPWRSAVDSNTRSGRCLVNSLPAVGSLLNRWVHVERNSSSPPKRVEIHVIQECNAFLIVFGAVFSFAHSHWVAGWRGAGARDPGRATETQGT